METTNEVFFIQKRSRAPAAKIICFYYQEGQYV